MCLHTASRGPWTYIGESAHVRNLFCQLHTHPILIVLTRFSDESTVPGTDDE